MWKRIRAARRQFDRTRFEAMKRLELYHRSSNLLPHQLILRDLLEISLSDLTQGRGRAPYLANYDQVRHLGEQLYKLGDHPLMLWACQRVPAYDQRELEACWHGIENWEHEASQS